MANLMRRTRRQEPSLFGGLDPFRSVRDLMRFDPLQELMRWEPFAELAGEETTFTPRMEVRDTTEAIVIKVDVPGVKEQDIDVSVAGNVLTLSGKREHEARTESDQYYAYERSYGSFARSLTLPEGCDAEQVKADLKDGVLTVMVPKRPSVHARRIPIGAGKEEPKLEGKPQVKAA